jgi:hypothetical protein
MKSPLPITCRRAMPFSRQNHSRSVVERRRQLRVVGAEDDVEVVVSLSPDEFQQVVRVALTRPRATVADVIREMVSEGLAGWPARVRRSA